MKKNIAKSFVLVMMLTICSVLNIKLNSFHVDADVLDARGEYYDLNGINSKYLNDIVSTSGIDLQNGLSILMSATQTEITSYSELKNETIKTDVDPMNSENIITLYARDSISGVWDSSLWNREHVWCKSLSNGLYTSVAESNRNAGTDIHHLRPAYVTYNSSRQDRPYGEVDMSVATELGNTGNFAMSGMFEPRDDIKGDVARILMYVYVRYSSSLSSTSGEKGSRGNLRITDIVKTSSNTDTDAWNLLLKWNENDPVDYLEMHRNDEAEKLQGNRNVFIDHPEFAKMCFGNYQGQGALIDLENTYDDNSISYLGINIRNTTLIAGKNEKFVAKTFPTNITSPAIKWRSSDNSIITIDTLGNAIAINEGNATIEVFTETGLKAKCNVEVVNEKLIYKYDGNALSSTSTYNPNIKSEFEYNDITMEVQASFGSANNGNLWLGAGGTKVSQGIISKDDPIGKAINLDSNKRGAVLYFNGELESVGKITFQQIGGQANTYLYLLYSQDEGNTYQRIGNVINLGGSTSILNFNFETIDRARYAFALTTSDSAMVQSKKPCVSFYSGEVTGDELVEDLLNCFDKNDNNNSIFQATLITKAYEIFNTLSENEKNQISSNNIAKITSLSNDELQGYEFIYRHWSKTSDDLTSAELDEIILAFNNLSEGAKSFVSNMKSDTIESDNDMTIGDVIEYLQTGEKPDDKPTPGPDTDDPAPKPGSNSQTSESGKDDQTLETNPNDDLLMVIGIVAGILVIAVALVLILKNKRNIKK